MAAGPSSFHFPHTQYTTLKEVICRETLAFNVQSGKELQIENKNTDNINFNMKMKMKTRMKVNH